MKTCNFDGFCSYKILGDLLYECKYEKYCDFKAPRDSRMSSYKYDKDTCGNNTQEESAYPNEEI